MWDLGQRPQPPPPTTCTSARSVVLDLWGGCHGTTPDTIVWVLGWRPNHPYLRTPWARSFVFIIGWVSLKRGKKKRVALHPESVVDTVQRTCTRDQPSDKKKRRAGGGNGGTPPRNRTMEGSGPGGEGDRQRGISRSQGQPVLGVSGTQQDPHLMCQPRVIDHAK